MGKANVKREDKGPGADMINTQRIVDEGMNEAVKAERTDDNVNEATDNRDTKHVRDVSQKKSGRTSH